MSGSIVERLRRKAQVTPATGGGTISIGGEASHYITDDGRRHINPDGPEAADTIECLLEALEAVVEGNELVAGHHGINARKEAAEHPYSPMGKAYAAIRQARGEA